MRIRGLFSEIHEARVARDHGSNNLELRNYIAKLEDVMFEGLFQPMHLLVIAGLALLIFGPKKLPELGKGLGDGIRGFKSAMNGGDKAPEPPKEAEANRLA